MNSTQRKSISLKKIALSFMAFIITGSLSYAANDQLQLSAVKVTAEKVAASMLMDVVNTGERLVAVGERGHILYSEDNGQSWVQADVPVSVTLTAVYFPSPQKGWVVGHDGVVLHSQDGGSSWSKQLDAMQGLELNLSHGRKLIEAMETRLAEASDEERATLELEHEDLLFAVEDLEMAVEREQCCDPLMDVWFKNDQEGFVIGSFGVIYRTSDAGKNWRPWWEHVDNPDRMHLNAIVEAKDALLMAGETGSLFRSVDGGEYFEALESPYEGTLFGAVADPDESYMMAFGIGGNLLCSEDKGDSWRHQKTNAGGGLSGAVVGSDGMVTIASYSGALLTGSCNTPFKTQKIMSGWTGLTEANDGSFVLIGLGGAHRVEQSITATEGR